MGGLTRSRSTFVICALALTFVFVSGALGAANTLQITGKRHVTAGATAKLVVSGYSNAGRGIAIFISKRDCAQTFAAEQKRSDKKTIANRQIHTGSFRFTVSFTHSVPGRHVLCAYLYNNRLGKPTVRRAQFAYTTS